MLQFNASFHRSTSSTTTANEAQFLFPNFKAKDLHTSQEVFQLNGTPVHPKASDLSENTFDEYRIPDTGSMLKDDGSSVLLIRKRVQEGDLPTSNHVMGSDENVGLPLATFRPQGVRFYSNLLCTICDYNYFCSHSLPVLHNLR